MYDVIIVGGGPAGSTAGIVLSKAGFNVLIVDKDIFPRDKLCGGALTLKTEKLLQNIGIHDYTYVIDFKTNYYSIYWKNKEIFKGKSDYQFLFVKRKVYDHFLLEHAKKSGAKVLQGEKVIKVDFKGNYVITDKGNSFKYKYLISADGVHSKIRKQAEKEGYLVIKNWRDNLANAIEIYIDKRFLKQEIKYPFIIFDYVKWGYGWIFPNKNRIVVGAGGLLSKNKDLQAKFLKLLNDFFPEHKPKKLFGHPIPFGNFLEKPAFKNVLFAGDAGGITNPASGEGIYSAQKSGELAGLSIIKAEKENIDASNIYIELVKKHIYPEFRRDLFIRNIAYPFSSSFLTKIIFSLFHKKLEHVIHN